MRGLVESFKQFYHELKTLTGKCDLSQRENKRNNITIYVIYVPEYGPSIVSKHWERISQHSGNT